MPLINVKTEHFEGPFSLLVHLIEKNEIDIYDIPIAALTDQYMEYIASFTGQDMDAMSEFVLMAATLLEIKSKMLLPKDNAAGLEEEDPRAELVRRLIEYKKYRGVLDIFRQNEENGQKYWYREYDATLSAAGFAVEKQDVSEILDGLSLDGLYAVFEEVLNRRELRTDKVRAGFNSVSRDLYTVEEKIRHIENLIKIHGKIGFYSIFNPNVARIEKVVTFLALLELIKIKAIRIYQRDLFEEITITGMDKDDAKKI